MFDSGASRSLIRSDVAERLSTPRELLIERRFTAADGHMVTCKHVCDLVVEIAGKRIGIEAFPVDDLPVPMIFGALDMEAYTIKLDLAGKTLDLSEFTGNMLALASLLPNSSAKLFNSPLRRLLHLLRDAEYSGSEVTSIVFE